LAALSLSRKALDLSPFAKSQHIFSNLQRQSVPYAMEYQYDANINIMNLMSYADN
jgi:hypothetical protein